MSGLSLFAPCPTRDKQFGIVVDILNTPRIYFPLEHAKEISSICYGRRHSDSVPAAFYFENFLLPTLHLDIFAQERLLTYDLLNID
jgi:hypothetical protein